MKTNLNINIGKDESGKDLIIDLAQIKNLLIAGNAGTGKSTIIHSILHTLLSNNTPENFRMILIDSKQSELSVYNNIPNLLIPVISETKKAILALKHMVKEMERRMIVLKENNVKNIDEYYKDIRVDTMPNILLVVDELADIMKIYPKEMESALSKLLKGNYIAGIHLIISTSKPNSKIITKKFEDLINARIATQTNSIADSKLIIGNGEATKLHGPGDILFREGMKYVIRAKTTKKINLSEKESGMDELYENGKQKNKVITISDIIPDMKQDILEIQEQQSEVRFCERLIDENINKLSDLIGRKLTKKEERKILEIVDRYSPKLSDGNIIDYFPFDLAWKLYKIIEENNSDEGCLKNRYLDEDIFEIAKEHDLSLTETEEFQSFKDDKKFKDAEKAYEAWSSEN